MCASTWKGKKVIYLPSSCPGKQVLAEEGTQGMCIKDTNTVPFPLFLLLKLLRNNPSIYSARFGSIGEMT